MYIYPATDRELDNILEIQDLCYHEIEPESPEVIASKIYTSPDTCFIAKDNQSIRGYLLSLPSSLGNPPQLHSNTQTTEPNPNCLYLHDLAIHPNARGMGVGKLLIQHFAKIALQKQFEHASLISIQNSVPFWEKYGFKVVSADSYLQKKLKTYGENATYMECFLPQHYQLTT
ncbi:Ribosomal protein S18 acetylase RimI and related acetyltransferases (RimI) (PDB:1GHE) [Commensalibacter communis]|uniref:GNAT family N-acetyltransferase n=1 Tax=Commensalibacter communis TaxID=2972786 RepID=UPI0022FFB9F3|nr:GNAT family N-acetyltransferase [Commensalibacter communis]CAI3950887.1 Ribosomal protein S18 acetylase RimI and related acetyltransferases (RimI) (PDB:1GHE) [Commensalibacter communis]